MTGAVCVTGAECICPAACDCQAPYPDDGVAGYSNACPIHNDYPDHVPECEADEHKNGAWR